MYTHYVDGIVGPLRDAINKAGFRAGLLTGATDESGLEEFLKKDGKVDVLIVETMTL